VAGAFSPLVSGAAIGIGALGLPFFIAGGLKVVYDGPPLRDVQERATIRRTQSDVSGRPSGIQVAWLHRGP
jgi:hypothetical protein